MAYLVNGQSVRLTATLGIDLTGATVQCNYKKPSGATGYVSVTVTTAATGVLYADIPSATLNETGDWYFFLSGTLSGGNVIKSYGEKIRVLDEYAEEG